MFLYQAKSISRQQFFCRYADTDTYTRTTLKTIPDTCTVSTAGVHLIMFTAQVDTRHVLNADTK